jgi:hypothetical protein
VNTFGSVLISVGVLLSIAVTLFVVMPLIEQHADQDDPRRVPHGDSTR